MAIEPTRDAYGSQADASALADYLELLALADVSIKKANLADFIADSDWGEELRARAEEMFLGPGEEPDDFDAQDDARLHADRIVNLLKERERHLGDRYPFEFDAAEEALKRRRYTRRHDAYFALLAITVIHAYKVDRGGAPDPTEVFEDTLVGVLTTRGLLAANLASGRRTIGSFDDAVRAAGDLIRVRPNPAGGSRSAYAQDEGVDVVAHDWWDDERPAGWLYIAQATCGSSDSWKNKIKEPDPPSWRRFLNVLIQPVGLLAVPHHVEPDHLYDLTESVERMVLDRLRLVAFKRGISVQERALIRLMLRTPVQSPIPSQNGAVA